MTNKVNNPDFYVERDLAPHIQVGQQVQLTVWTGVPEESKVFEIEGVVAAIYRADEAFVFSLTDGVFIKVW